MTMMFVAVSLLLLTATMVTGEEPRCKSRSVNEVIAKLDCTGYYLCVFGRAIEMPDCPANSVFSPSVHICVPKGSIYDDCKMDDRPLLPDSGPLTIEEQCRLKGGIIPHPTECQAYYNCNHTYQDVPRLLEQHMLECPYPQLFNIETGKCDKFDHVDCGNRQAFKNGCDYRSNQCPFAHCIPCNVRFPTCEGKPDGIHEHETKLWSPYFIQCYKERMVSEERCPADNEGRSQLFHPEQDQCVPIDRITRDHGGMMPDCSAKPDGFYPDEFQRCNVYNVCKNGVYLNQVRCAQGEAYEARLEACLPVDQVCGPCGNRNDC